MGDRDADGAGDGTVDTLLVACAACGGVHQASRRQALGWATWSVTCPATRRTVEASVRSGPTYVEDAQRTIADLGHALGDDAPPTREP
jgi:hypothetical protein